MDSNTRLHSCQVLPKKKPDEFSDPQASLDIDKLVSCGYSEGQLRVIFRFFIFDHYQLTPLKIRIGGRKRVEKMILISLEECCGSESQIFLLNIFFVFYESLEDYHATGDAKLRKVTDGQTFERLLLMMKKE